MIELRPPLKDEDIEKLKAGDSVLLSGVIYTARDAAHQRIVELAQHQESLPFDFKGQIIYYAGPTPARPGNVIGAIGPTTSSRMDSCAILMLDLGIKATIGKGWRSQKVKESLIKNKAVYLVAVGGAAALLSKRVRKADTIAFSELGAEAVYKLEVEKFPAIVAYDCHGGDIFEQNINKYKKGGKS